MPNKLALHYTKLDRLPETNTLAYWYHSEVTEELKYFEYNTRIFVGSHQ
jgi:hypothetical protein